MPDPAEFSDGVASAVASCIREAYTQTGASVASSGVGNVVVELPADYPDLTDLVCRLKTDFDATSDLSTVNRVPRLTVWVPRNQRVPVGVARSYLAQWMCVAGGGVFLLAAFAMQYLQTVV